MENIPLYLKTDDDMARPEEAEFYLLARDGLYFCRNHRYFQSDVPTEKSPRWLRAHAASCRLGFPRLGKAALEYIVGFFSYVYQRHGSEAIAFLLWDQKRQRYRVLVPEQEATVWQGTGGRRSAQDVRYELPTPLPNGHILVADLHSHADHAAYTSWTDRRDERYRDGFHGVIGRIESEPPEFHLEFAVDGDRFLVDFGTFFRGYEKRRRIVPRTWLDKVKVRVEGPRFVSLGWNR